MSTQGSGRGTCNPKILHLSTYDAHGGAARAAYSIHMALINSGMQSRMRVGATAHSDPTIIANKKYPFMVAKEADRRLWSLQKSPTATWRSPARFGSVTATEINASNADIVHLHWVTDGFMSVETIGRINKPIVWSLCDAWAFSGAEHYATEISSLRSHQGYSKRNRPSNDSGFDVDRWTWERKRRHWTSPMHLVPASSWLTKSVEESALMSSWPITRIPHIVNTDVFTPRDPELARALIGIPNDRPVLLFLASAGIHDRRKGWDLLDQALQEIEQVKPMTVVIVGPPPSKVEQQTIESSSTHRFIFTGEVKGDEQLAALYASADITAVPSREDNMPITAMESQSCGTPVVAFNVGGLPDIVTHESTGYLAKGENPMDLARGITWTLDQGLREATRSRAIQTWSPSSVVPQLRAVYHEVLSS